TPSAYKTACSPMDWRQEKSNVSCGVTSTNRAEALPAKSCSWTLPNERLIGKLEAASVFVEEDQMISHAGWWPRGRIALALALGCVLSRSVEAQVYRLAELNIDQIRMLDRQRTVILLPGGVLEEHGPY